MAYSPRCFYCMYVNMSDWPIHPTSKVSLSGCFSMSYHLWVFHIHTSHTFPAQQVAKTRVRIEIHPCQVPPVDLLARRLIRGHGLQNHRVPCDIRLVPYVVSYRLFWGCCSTGAIPVVGHTTGVEEEGGAATARAFATAANRGILRL